MPLGFNTKFFFVVCQFFLRLKRQGAFQALQGHLSPINVSANNPFSIERAIVGDRAGWFLTE